MMKKERKDRKFEKFSSKEELKKGRQRTKIQSFFIINQLNPDSILVLNKQTKPLVWLKPIVKYQMIIFLKKMEK